MKRKTIALVLGSIFILFISNCRAPTPTPVPAPTPTPDTTLRGALTKIHDQFTVRQRNNLRYQPDEIQQEYHESLKRMTVLLFTDPRAQDLSLAERETLFEEIVGFGGVQFTPGNGEATLVSLRTYRNQRLSSHAEPPDMIYVVDRQGSIYDFGISGRTAQTWWIDDRWIVHSLLGSFEGYRPMQMRIWHIGQVDGAWQRLLKLEFDPLPYYGPRWRPPRFEDGYQVMTTDFEYWWTQDPCEFTPEFKDTYENRDFWRMRQTFQLVDNSYELTSREVLSFTVRHKHTGKVETNWQEYCIEPIE
jgi:hypothetical protein